MMQNYDNGFRHIIYQFINFNSTKLMLLCYSESLVLLKSIQIKVQNNEIISN